MDLREECNRLRQMGNTPPCESARKALLEGLHSKWNGVQVTAARALAQWGDKQSVENIKDLLTAFVSKSANWGPVSAVAQALSLHLNEHDISWVLDLYFVHSKRSNRFVLTSLFSNLPAKKTLAALNDRMKKQYIHERDTEQVFQAIEYFSKQAKGQSVQKQK